MRIWRRRGDSSWKFLMIAFAAIALAAAVLPGCGDDTSDDSSDTDSQYDSQYIPTHSQDI